MVLVPQIWPGLTILHPPHEDIEAYWDKLLEEAQRVSAFKVVESFAEIEEAPKIDDRDSGLYLFRSPTETESFADFGMWRRLAEVAERYKCRLVVIARMTREQVELTQRALGNRLLLDKDGQASVGRSDTLVDGVACRRPGTV